MTKTKSTKRALLLSALSLLMCVSMLIGSTFAWFTDSVVSGNNIIKAGNLDIVLEYSTDGDIWNTVDATTKVFNDEALWEPGHREVVMFRVRNAGTLHLKYELLTTVIEEKGSVNVYGDEFKLSDHLTLEALAYAKEGLGFEEMVENFFASRNPWFKMDKFEFGQNMKVANAVQEMAPGYEHYYFVAITMPETVGNEANYATGNDAPYINFAINLVATQFTVEKDSFGSQYDKDADYVEYDYKVDTLEELKEAFKNGGNVILTDDIEFEKITPVEPGADVYLNLNGKTITVDENTTSNTLIWVKEGAKLTVDGNGTIDMGDVSTMAIFCPYGELVIENGTFIRNKVTTVTDATTGLFMGAKITSSNVTINGGYFDPGYYDINAANIEDILAGTAEFTETEDDIAKRGNSKDANLFRVAVKDNVSVTLNHSGYGSFKVYGGTFVGANPAWGDEGCMLPTTPNYLRPWSYYQGALLDGQTFHENGIVLPEGYTITKGTTADGIPTYTVEYNK